MTIDWERYAPSCLTLMIARPPRLGSWAGRSIDENWMTLLGHVPSGQTDPLNEGVLKSLEAWSLNQVKPKFVRTVSR